MMGKGGILVIERFREGEKPLVGYVLADNGCDVKARCVLDVDEPFYDSSVLYVLFSTYN